MNSIQFNVVQSTMSQILSGLFGTCVGDALGVPVEFSTRRDRDRDPVAEMRGYGMHQQPPGTWSDDSSLALCLADALCEGYSLDRIARNFCAWYDRGDWTARGNVFDIGITTSLAIGKLKQGISPTEAGGRDERSNGNGSLMRILPLAFYRDTIAFSELIRRTCDCSCLTHAHARSQLACSFYIAIALGLLRGLDPKAAYLQGIHNIHAIDWSSPYHREFPHFDRISSGRIETLSVQTIQSGGYVVETLEASLWCLLTSQTYAETVLKAVNLGSDTDTTGAVAGGLAGIYYGIEGIPPDWIQAIARHDDIADLGRRLEIAIAAS